jgi:hypothetical protein
MSKPRIGTMTDRGSGRWRLQVAVDPDPVSGERRRLSRTIRGTGSEAKDALQRLVVDDGACHARFTAQDPRPRTRCSAWSWTPPVASRGPAQLIVGKVLVDRPRAACKAGGSDTLWGMCRQVTCRKCGRPSWKGCGAHVEQVLRKVPPAERCHCNSEKTPQPATPKRKSWFSR